MKKRILISALASALLLAVTACDGSTETSDDATEETQHDPAPDPSPDPTPDTTPDPTPDSIEDPVPDEIDDVIEEDAPPVQDPITFIVRNTSAETIYMQVYGNNIGGGRTTGGAWAPIDYWTPFCMVDCNDIEPGGDCCLDCMPPPAVKALDAGEDVTLEWDGRNVFETDPDYCSMCSCYRPVDVIPMGYRAEACVYHTFDCWAPPCEPNEDGIIDGANVTGEPSCGETIFDIPYAESEVVIEVM